jgi:GNAT superfamily N-acetyltransferase
VSSIEPDATAHLPTGWEPEAPTDDTLVRRAVHLHASWPTTVASAIGRPWRWTDDWAGGFLADKGALSNPILLLRPPVDIGRVLDEVAELVPPASPYFLLSRWQAPDLTPHGLVLLGHPPLMVRFPAAHDVVVPSGVEIVEVDAPDELAVAERVLVAGYPMPDLEPLAPGDLLGPSILTPATRVWLARVDGEPAAVAASHAHAGVTLVEYVATLPAARGRGAGSAVTWAATLAEPSHPAMLVASDDGRPVYESMGFVAIERWTAWLRPAA